MNLQPHQARVLQEFFQLEKKLLALNAFIESNPAHRELPEEEQILLAQQSEHMEAYLETLRSRLWRWGIAPHQGEVSHALGRTAIEAFATRNEDLLNRACGENAEKRVDGWLEAVSRCDQHIMKYTFTFQTDDYKLAESFINIAEGTPVTQRPIPAYKFEHNFKPKLGSIEAVKAEFLRLIGDVNTDAAIGRSFPSEPVEVVKICLRDLEFASQVAETIQPHKFRDGKQTIIKPVFLPVDRDTNPDGSLVDLELYY
jgi:hypothetical protein